VIRESRPNLEQKRPSAFSGKTRSSGRSKPPFHKPNSVSVLLKQLVGPVSVFKANTCGVLCGIFKVNLLITCDQ
jgi:hypothetical protein